MRAEVEKKVGSVTLVKFDTPTEIFVALKRASDFHVYLGRLSPPDARAKASGLGMPDLGAYLMFDGRDLEGVLPDRPLPGVALALGASGGVEWGFSFGPLSLRIWAEIGFDLGVSLDLPPLLQGDSI